MAENLKAQIGEEIDRIRSEIDEQKRLIKKSMGKKLVIETAEGEMRALRARLAVLEANMAKYAD